MAKIFSFFLTTVIFLLIVSVSVDLQAQMMFRDESKPRVTGWVDDTHFIFQTFDKNKKTVIQKIEIKTGKSEAYVPVKSEREKMEAALPKGISMGRNDLISTDGKTAILFRSNDLFCFTTGDSAMVQLTRDSLPEVNARFSPDNQKIAYTKEKDLYIFNLVTGKEIRITFDATDKVYNGWSSWVYMEEILGRASNYAAFWWS
ncbi:MAG TPA: DPP IV N-terminal domain-containing protein, partial [Prolixibacteraceae bacterium]|nr:DPP IV N-terminal domain-containing protein [Prolixibacteraceae bacterium]